MRPLTASNVASALTFAPFQRLRCLATIQAPSANPFGPLDFSRLRRETGGIAGFFGVGGQLEAALLRTWLLRPVWVFTSDMLRQVIPTDHRLHWTLVDVMSETVAQPLHLSAQVLIVDYKGVAFSSWLGIVAQLKVLQQIVSKRGLSGLFIGYGERISGLLLWQLLTNLADAPQRYVTERFVVDDSAPESEKRQQRQRISKLFTLLLRIIYEPIRAAIELATVQKIVAAGILPQHSQSIVIPARANGIGGALSVLRETGRMYQCLLSQIVFTFVDYVVSEIVAAVQKRREETRR